MFRSGRKLVSSGIIMSLAFALVPSFSAQTMHTFMIIANIAVVAGFVLMWLASGNILCLATGGAYGVGYLLALLIPASGIFISIIANIYLLIWAFKRFTDGNIIPAVALGAVFIASIFSQAIRTTLTPLIGEVYAIYYYPIALAVVQSFVALFERDTKEK